MYTSIAESPVVIRPTRRSRVAVVSGALLLHLLLCAGLYVRLAPWRAASVAGIVLRSDAVHYHIAALNMLAGRGFSLMPMPPYLPDTFRTPLYPALVAVVYALCGARPWVVLLFQIALSAVALLLLARMVDLFFQRGAGSIAAFLYAIHPLVLVNTLNPYTENVFLFLWLACSALWLACAARPAAWGGVLCGATLGLCTLCRPVTLYCALWLFPLLIIVAPGAWWRRILCAVLGSAAFVLVVAPWSVRNYRLTGAWQLSCADAVHLYWQAAPLTLAQAAGTTAADERDKLEQRFLAQYTPVIIPEYAGLYICNPARTNELALRPLDDPRPRLDNYHTIFSAQKRLALDVLATHPAAFAIRVGIGAARTLATPPWQEFLRLTMPRLSVGDLLRDVQRQPAAALRAREYWPAWLAAAWMGAYTLIVLFLAALGMVRLWRAPFRMGVRLFTVLTLVYFLIIPCGYGEARYGTALVPVLLPLAAVGLSWVASRGRM